MFNQDKLNSTNQNMSTFTTTSTTTTLLASLNNINTTKNSLGIDELNTLLNKTELQSTFFFSILLFIITFIVCMGLKSFRDKPFLPSKVNLFLILSITLKLDYFC